MRIQMLYRNPGERVRVKQPENSCRLPDGLNEGDEVLIVSGWDHSYYGVEKDGVIYNLVSFMCIPHELGHGLMSRSLLCISDSLLRPQPALVV